MPKTESEDSLDNDQGIQNREECGQSSSHPTERKKNGFKCSVNGQKKILYLMILQ